MATPSHRPSSTAPRPGELVELTASASVQFADSRSMRLRVIQVDPRSTCTGWVWLHGYSVDLDGNVVERREVFVQRAGLRRISTD